MTTVSKKQMATVSQKQMTTVSQKQMTKPLLEGVNSFLLSLSLGCSSAWPALHPLPSLLHNSLYNMDLSRLALRNGTLSLWGIAEVRKIVALSV